MHGEIDRKHIQISDLYLIQIFKCLRIELQALKCRLGKSYSNTDQVLISNQIAH